MTSDEFITAVKNKNISAVDEYLNNGGNVNAATPLGTTALMWAVRNNDKEMVALLLEAGADVNITNSEDKTVLDIAQNLEIAQDIRNMLNKARPTLPDLWAKNEPKTEIDIFVHTVSTKKIEEYLKKGLSIDVYCKKDLPPSEPYSYMKYTALLEACMTKKISKALFLIRKGANVNLPVILGEDTEENGKSPLMYAAWFKSYTLMEELLKAGADMDYRTSAGESVWENKSTVTWLTEYKIKSANERFYKAAIDGDTSYVINNLPKTNDNTKIKSFVNTPYVEIAKILKKSGVDINATLSGRDAYSVYHGSHIYPALAVACKENYTEKAKWLIQEGADVNLFWESCTYVAGMANVDDTDRFSPLMWCVKNKNTELVKMLLDANADVNFKGHEGYTESADITALYIAKRTDDEITKLLMQKGAKE